VWPAGGVIRIATSNKAMICFVKNGGSKLMKLKSIAISVVAAGLWALPVVAQDAAQKSGGGKVPPSASQIVLAQWNEIGRKLTAMAEDFPEDKYDFKATPAVRSFAEQLLHAAGGTYYFTNPVLGQPVADGDPARTKYKTKAEVVAFVKKSIEDGAAVIKAKGDKGMTDLVADPESKQQMHVSDLAYGLIEHSGEHYGQLVLYYRVAGLVPPESRPKK
jgi:DinB family